MIPFKCLDARQRRIDASADVVVGVSQLTAYAGNGVTFRVTPDRKPVGYHRTPMGVEISVVPPGEVDADVVAVAIPEDDRTLAPDLDARLDEHLRELLADGEIRGEIGEAVLVHLEAAGAPARLAAAGIGPAGNADTDAFRTALAALR